VNTFTLQADQHSSDHKYIVTKLDSNHYKQAAIEAWARHIEAYVQPDMYGVGTLKQAIVNGNVMIKGDPYRYQEIAKQFIIRLSSRINGRTNFERHRTEIPAAVTLEGDGSIKRFHLNFLIKKPEWLSWVDFTSMFRIEWDRLDWSRDDLDLNARTGDCVRYSLKEGPDSLIYLNRPAISEALKLLQHPFDERTRTANSPPR
jgi:hypothetical protein